MGGEWERHLIGLEVRLTIQWPVNNMDETPAVLAFPAQHNRRLSESRQLFEKLQQRALLILDSMRFRIVAFWTHINTKINTSNYIFEYWTRILSGKSLLHVRTFNKKNMSYPQFNMSEKSLPLQVVLRVHLDLCWGRDFVTFKSTYVPIILSDQIGTWTWA